MGFKKILLGILMLEMLAVSGYALYAGSWAGIVSVLRAPWGLQIALDLTVAVVLASSWIWRDARAHGRNPVPWMFFIVATGSVGLLSYLLARPSGQRSEDVGLYPARQH